MSLEKIQEISSKILDKLSTSSNDLVITSKNCDETIYFDHPFNVKDGKIAFKLLSTYYSIPNIKPGNNVFRYKTQLKDDFLPIELETGAWEFSAITDFLRESFEYMNKKRFLYNTNEIAQDEKELEELVEVLMGDLPESEHIEDKKKSKQKEEKHKPMKPKSSMIHISLQPSTMKTIMDIPPKHEVDFFTAGTIRNIFGFNKEIYEEGRWISENIIDINPVNTIQIHCNIVNGAIINGQPSNCVHIFEPRVDPGHKIIVEPKNLVYYPVNGLENISKMRVWLTDGYGNLIDNRGEKLTIVLSLKV